LSFGASFETYYVQQLGKPVEWTDNDYRNAGLLPPGERCPPIADGSIVCP
jgi:hypothetical protein